MGESSEDLQQSFFRRHWEGYKEFWAERFSILDNYSRFVKRDKPLPSWSALDVQEFIASDPVHGPTVALSLSLSIVYGDLPFRLVFDLMFCLHFVDPLCLLLDTHLCFVRFLMLFLAFVRDGRLNMAYFARRLI